MNRNIVLAAKLLTIAAGGVTTYSLATMFSNKMERTRKTNWKKAYRAEVMKVVSENTDLLFDDIMMENF